MGAELWDSAWGGFTAGSDTPAGPADIPALPGGRQSPGCSASAASGSGRLIHPAGSGAICGAGLQLPLTQVQPPTGAAFGAALAPSPPGWAVPRARCRDGDTDGAAGAGWPQSGVPTGTARLAHTASLSPRVSWKRSSRPWLALCCVSQAAAGQQAPGSLWLAHAGHRGGSGPRGLRRAAPSGSLPATVSGRGRSGAAWAVVWTLKGHSPGRWSQERPGKGALSGRRVLDSRFCSPRLPTGRSSPTLKCQR